MAIKEQSASTVSTSDKTSPGQPLSTLSAGQSARIIALASGAEFRNRMTSMGLHPGAEVRVLRSSGGRGPMMVSTGESRLMLGRGMTEKILVVPAPASDNQ